MPRRSQEPRLVPKSLRPFSRLGNFVYQQLRPLHTSDRETETANLSQDLQGTRGRVSTRATGTKENYLNRYSSCAPIVLGCNRIAHAGTPGKRAGVSLSLFRLVA